MAIAFDQAGGGTGTATSVQIDITAAATGSVVYCHAQISSNVGATTMTNWTLVHEQDEGTSSHGALWRRVKVGGDTTFTVSWTGSNNATASWASYTGVDTTTPDELATQLDHTASSASYVTSSQTPTAANRWALSTYGYRSTTAARTWSNATATQRVDTENTTSRWSGTSIADSNGVVTQAAHSYTATLSVSEGHGTTFILFLIPAAAAAAAPSATIGNIYPGQTWGLYFMRYQTRIYWYPRSAALTQWPMTFTPVVTTYTTTKQVNKPLTLTAVASTFSVAKQVGKALTLTAVSTAFSLVKQVGKILSFNTSTAFADAKQVLKPLVLTAVATTFSMVASAAKNANLGFTAVVSAFGITPAVQTTEKRPSDVLREDHAKNTGNWSTTPQDVFREQSAASPDDSWTTRLRNFFRSRF